jgi:hypothetical protein
MPEAAVVETETSVARRAETAVQVNRTICIRDVPYGTWERARHNSLRSKMGFRAYLVRLLAESLPFVEDSPSEEVA